MSPKNKKLFVIWPMGTPGSDVRRLSEWIREKFILPAAKKAGYEEEGHGLAITPEIYRGLEGAPMVIAYLGCPPWSANVMFEVGYRMATNKPLVILKHENTDLPFDLYDFVCVDLPISDRLETEDESRVERIVEKITEELNSRKCLSRLESAYPVAEILIDQRRLPDKDRESIFTASSKAADTIFHVEDTLIGRNIIEVDKSLRPRIEECQVEPFLIEQKALLGQLYMGQSDDIQAKVPFIFKDKRVDVDSPEYVDPELRGRAFLPIIVQHRQLQSALSLRMVYYDATGTLKRLGDHFVCDFSKVNKARLLELIIECRSHNCGLVPKLEAIAEGR